MRSNGRMKQRLASSSVGAQSQRSLLDFRSLNLLYVKCRTAAWSEVSSLQLPHPKIQNIWLFGLMLYSQYRPLKGRRLQSNLGGCEGQGQNKCFFPWIRAYNDVHPELTNPCISMHKCPTTWVMARCIYPGPSNLVV